MLTVVGLAFVLVGFCMAIYGLQPRPVPPVDILWNDSSWGKVNDVYFDFVVIRNHGADNVTVVVEIQDLMDTKPRISDPVTLCSGCNATVQIEAVQPPPSLTSDEYSVYTQQLGNPESIRVDYLSTVLITRLSDDLTAGAAVAVVAGVFLIVRGQGSTRRRRRA